MNRLQKVIVLVDTSDSMKTNARDVRKALHLIDDTLKSYKNYEVRTTLHIVAYNEKAHFVSRNSIDSIRFGGRANLSSGLNKLREIFSANTLYTYPPIVLLLSNGCTTKNYKEVINKLRLFNTFQFSSKVGFVFSNYKKYSLQPLKDVAGNSIYYGDNMKAISEVLIEKLPKLVVTRNKRKEFYYAS